jgi:hypothetical protein
MLVVPGGVAQSVRALACHVRGRGFESRRSRKPYGSIAQMVRAIPSYGRGPWFESRWSYFTNGCDPYLIGDEYVTVVASRS